MRLLSGSQPTLSSLACLFVFALAASAGTSMAGAAGNDAQDAHDAALVNAVKLDMGLVTRVSKVAKQTGAALEQSCLMGRGPAADKGKGLVVCGDALEKVPSIKAALSANGMSGRQFALGYSALLAAVMGGRGVMENEKEGWPGVRELGASPEHVRFYIAHHAEIDRLENEANP